ncbi:hypothetical protein AB0180_26830, partial [Klebsiella pneumoniae]
AGPAAWYGPEIASRGDWILTLDAEDVAEIAAATQPLAATEADIAALTPQDFPLPRLGPRLTAMLDDLMEGRGFALIRGLDISAWSMREAATAF